MKFDFFIKYNHRFVMLFILFSCLASSKAQVTIGDVIPPENFAILQIEGVEGGVRLPRLTEGQRNNLNSLLVGNEKAQGLSIYNLTTNNIDYWDGTQWVALPVLVVDNGLYLSSDMSVRLGGNLNQDTHISPQNLNLYFNATTGIFSVNSNALTFENNKVGIGTDNALSILHIDAARDNSLSPTATQLKNDILIDSDGKLGIGMLPVATDGSHLQINGPITVKNSGETPVNGEDYILTTSDGSGQAKWKRNTYIPPLVLGSLGGENGSPNGFAGRITSTGNWIGCSIILPPGKWIVQVCLVLKLGSSFSNGGYIYPAFAWSDSMNSTNRSSDVSAGFKIPGCIPQYKYGNAIGTSVIENTGTSDKTYYLNLVSITPNSGLGTITWDSLGSYEHDENIILAHPFIPNI